MSRRGDPSGTKRVKIGLECEVCGTRNYRKTKALKSDQEKPLLLKKFCPICGRHQIHRESR